MNKAVVTFFSLALITIPVHGTSQIVAQSRCNLTEATAPEVHGIRLGSTVDQVVALFPSSTKSKEMKDAIARAKAGDASETLYIPFDPADAAKDRFTGVDFISVGFGRGRVVDFTVGYGGATWRSVDEWVAKLAETFKLPGAQEWVVGPSENPNKILKCGAVEIEAGTLGGGALIRVRNTQFSKGMEERNAAAEEKKRREFKP